MAKKDMKHKNHPLWISILLMAGTPLLVSTFLTISFAQEDIYILAHENIFGKLRRPPVMFSHEGHADTLEDEGCGACHHLQDEESGPLLEGMATVQEWKPPVARGKRVFNDKAFYESLKKHYDSKGFLSERQRKVLRRMVERYSAGIEGYTALAEKLDLKPAKTSE